LAPFVLYFWLNTKKIDIWLLIASTGALLVAIPFSISRTLFFEVMITLIFAIIASLRKPENLNKIIGALFVGLISLAILSQTSYFTKATGAFLDRFTTANQQEGGFVKGVVGNRFLNGIFTSLTGTDNLPFWGQGIGMGTNVGATLLTGQTAFLISEFEWGRVIGELGPLMGFLVIILRVGLTFKLTFASYQKMIVGDLLPWLLLSFGFFNLSMGTWSQPTGLGFFVMIGGLLIASLKGEQITDIE
jgi:hypothetical protein